MSREEFAAHFPDVPFRIIRRWGTAARPLNLDEAIRSAEVLNTSVSYLVGIVTLDAPCSTYTLSSRLCEVMEECGETARSLAKKAGTNTGLVAEYMEGPASGYMNTWCVLSKELGVSLDYLLGLSEWRTWDAFAKSKNPFYGISPGDPILLCDPSTGARMNALLHICGQTVILSNCTEKPLSAFDGYSIYPCRPEGGDIV